MVIRVTQFKTFFLISMLPPVFYVTLFKKMGYAKIQMIILMFKKNRQNLTQTDTKIPLRSKAKKKKIQLDSI